MPNDSVFRRLSDPPDGEVTIRFDGQPVAAREGDSVAAALLAAGFAALRTTPAGGNPRGPWCMMGVCFDCLVEIDGVPNMQACMTPVREGMEIRPMSGARSLGGGDG